MDCSKKFIVTQDESVSNQLIAHGFHLLSNVSGTYTFVNETPEKFNFADIDTTKIYFTNILHI